MLKGRSKEEERMKKEERKRKRMGRLVLFPMAGRRGGKLKKSKDLFHVWDALWMIFVIIHRSLKANDEGF